MNTVSRFGTKARTAFAVAMIAGAAGHASAQSTGSGGTGTVVRDNFSHLPSTLVLNATIRDFRAANQSGGHQDFQRFTGNVTVGLVRDTLDANNKPVSINLRGSTVTTSFKDSANRNIMPALFDAARGDRQGVLSPGGTGNGLTSHDLFNQWYRDVPGVNVSMQLPLTLNRRVGTNQYTFDSANDEPYKSRGGFFPINGELFGNFGNNSAGINSNFHFTTELSTEFVFTRGSGQVFMFSGDDDVWVFINGRLVIDLGGLHSRAEQWIDLDRLSWLQSGQQYSLHVFHAERRTTQSNFRVETTIQLRSVEPPSVTALYD